MENTLNKFGYETTELGAKRLNLLGTKRSVTETDLHTWRQTRMLVFFLFVCFLVSFFVSGYFCIEREEEKEFDEGCEPRTMVKSASFLFWYNSNLSVAQLSNIAGYNLSNIFLVRHWSTRFTWSNIPQLKLVNIPKCASCDISQFRTLRQIRYRCSFKIRFKLKVSSNFTFGKPFASRNNK